MTLHTRSKDNKSWWCIQQVPFYTFGYPTGVVLHIFQTPDMLTAFSAISRNKDVLHILSHQICKYGCAGKTYLHIYIPRVSSDPIHQWYSNLAREIHFPAEFSSNPDQTHLPGILKTLISMPRCVWLGLLRAELCRKVDLTSQIWVSLLYTFYKKLIRQPALFYIYFISCYIVYNGWIEEY